MISCERWVEHAPCLLVPTQEYAAQRYEGAFTLYGPHTLDAYIEEFVRLVGAMLSGEPVTSAAQPEDLHARQISLLPPVVVDATPLGSRFGDVVLDAEPAYAPGGQVVVKFR